MSKVSSRRRSSSAGSAAQSSNVIQLPVVRRAEGSLTQPLLFAEDDLRDSPPWLIEESSPPEAKPGNEKRPTVKKPAPKKSAAKRPAKKVAAKPKTAKLASKRAASPRRTKASVASAVFADDAIAQQVPTSDTPSDMAQPIERAMAPVVWRKNGPLDAVRFWLRSAGRSLKTAFGSRPQREAAAKLADPRLRTRKELLGEIAILRQENAAMRKKLGLPAAPFGRLVADRI